jgi:uncharacterized protein
MSTNTLLSGKTALITGATSGIGKELAELFARDGANLILAARSASTLTQLASDWSVRFGIKVNTFACDLAQIGAAQTLVEWIQNDGLSVDFLINNAGVGAFGKFQDSDLQAELAMMTLNMSSLTVLNKLLLPELIKRRGKIMNVASTAAFQPGPFMAVYYASKAYVLSLSEALSEELRGSGVTVTALCPGPTASGFQDKAAMHDSALVKGKSLPTAKWVAEKGYRALMSGRRVCIPGVMNWLLAESVRFTPRAVITRIVAMLSAPKT